MTTNQRLTFPAKQKPSSYQLAQRRYKTKIKNSQFLESVFILVKRESTFYRKKLDSIKIFATEALHVFLCNGYKNAVLMQI